MTRTQLEHIIRAAGAITDERTILVLGSQSILGKFPEPPPELIVSTEADVCPVRSPDKADMISGAIGELTAFQGTFGYYAHGLPPSACSLPRGWEKRLVPISNPNTSGVTGLCLDPLDLTCAKLAAGRSKDIEFVVAMIRHRFVEVDQLGRSIIELPNPEHRAIAQRSLTTAISRAMPRPFQSPARQITRNIPPPEPGMDMGM